MFKTNGKAGRQTRFPIWPHWRSFKLGSFKKKQHVSNKKIWEASDRKKKQSQFNQGNKDVGFPSESNGGINIASTISLSRPQIKTATLSNEKYKGTVHPLPQQTITHRVITEKTGALHVLEPITFLCRWQKEKSWDQHKSNISITVIPLNLHHN